MHSEIVKNYLINLQNEFCHLLEMEDEQGQFSEDNWQYPQGGGGCTRTITNGAIFEKGGVNFSHVFANKLPASVLAQRPELSEHHFQAMGVSLVIHPYNPFIPTTHFNLRFFLAEKPGDKSAWWFGGGFDLTPYYGFIEDCQHWHNTAKAACDPFGKDVYATFKKQCDDYFYLKHRNEPRGIGGIFFDYLTEWGFEQSFAFVKNVGNHFLPAYLPIVSKRKQHSFTEEHKNFQNYRRGRYVEFNLIYDRGTLFGLQSGGRTESILVSMPPQATWRYNWQPTPGSLESELYEKFLIIKDWVSS